MYSTLVHCFALIDNIYLTLQLLEAINFVIYFCRIFFTVEKTITFQSFTDKALPVPDFVARFLVVWNALECQISSI